MSGSAVHHLRPTCRACGQERFYRVLSLGPCALANAFLGSPREFAGEPKFPLDLYFCETCSLIQLLDVIDAEVLFRSYLYVTGTSETMAEHNREYAQGVVDRLGLQPADLVVEVASNDGSLLDCFRPYGIRVLGIEPAANITALARARGIETHNDFFDARTAAAVLASHGPARALLANNVLAHVDDTQGFLRACRSLLAPDGLLVVEVPYLRDLLDRLEYDTIYHEHLCYFSVGTLLRLCSSVGLAVVDVRHVPVHGGSLRLSAGLPEHYGEHAATVLAWTEEEERLGLTRRERYVHFAADVAENRRALKALLEELKRAGKVVAGYGAPAKGNTLLSYCGIDTRLLPFTVDKNPLKVGRFTPGTHIPVLPVETLLDRRPDYLLLLAWNLTDEIMRQQQAYREHGGRFIVPVPQPQVV